MKKECLFIACLIRTCYKPIFFARVKECLSEKDYAEILVDYWSALGITDEPKSKFLSWFKGANKEYLMNKSEQKKFDKLHERVTIYCGASSFEYKYGFL